MVRRIGDRHPAQNSMVLRNRHRGGLAIRIEELFLPRGGSQDRQAKRNRGS
jgi:hypothetical protein